MMSIGVWQAVGLIVLGGLIYWFLLRKGANKKELKRSLKYIKEVLKSDDVKALRKEVASLKKEIKTV